MEKALNRNKPGFEEDANKTDTQTRHMMRMEIIGEGCPEEQEKLTGK